MDVLLLCLTLLPNYFVYAQVRATIANLIPLVSNDNNLVPWCRLHHKAADGNHPLP